MPSLHNFILEAFVRCLEGGTQPLFLADVNNNYGWNYLADGTAVAKEMGQNVTAQSMEFLIFGVVRSLREDGAVLLSSPQWHDRGIAGSILTVRYSQQMLALAKALDSHGLDAFFDHEAIIISTRNRPRLTIGTAVFATTTLKVIPTLGNREEHYVLDVIGGLICSYQLPCLMTSTIRPFLLPGFLEYYRTRPAPLSVSEDWAWVKRKDGLNAQAPKARKGFRSNAPVKFAVWGMVTGTHREGIVELKRPRWEADGVAGRELGIQFDMQLLTLCRALELHVLDNRIPNDTIALTTDSTDIPIGAALFATCLLSVLDNAADDAPERYKLDVLTIDGLYLDFVPVRVKYSPSAESAAAGHHFHKLLSRLKTADDDDETFQWLSTMWIGDLWTVALADEECMAKVIKYTTTACNGSGPVSDVGFFAMLPLELDYRLLEFLSPSERVILGRASKGFNWICRCYMQSELQVLLAVYKLDFTAIRLMLTATATVMSGWAFHSIFNNHLLPTDALDFVTTEKTSAAVLAFLTLSSAYALSGMSTNNTDFKSWTLKLDGRKIRVLEYPVDYGTAMLTSHVNHRMGYCDGSTVRHPYGGIAYDRIAFATPSCLPIRNRPRELKKTWEIVHAALDHGYTWYFELTKRHVCGRHPYCPATPRTTIDDGWLNLRLPDAGFGSADKTRSLGWSLYGSGCDAGILGGGAVESTSVYEGTCVLVQPEAEEVSSDGETDDEDDDEDAA
ncbi:hypothetical protein C8R47DRAFT_1062791 [Mycena vitilis]|nr:hypothetical protein C8R47DRAFT_1062791 [Mycena vitilis]